jgi:hypothetical protein
MNLKTALILSVVVGTLFVLAVPFFAQEGYPLTGVWYGDYGPNAKDRTQVTIIMNWDGKAVSGQINPGPDAIPLKTVTLDSQKGWTVHIEAEGKDEKGKAIRYVADGKLENIGSYNRTISGTWNDGSSAKNDFKLKRD